MYMAFNLPHGAICSFERVTLLQVEFADFAEISIAKGDASFDFFGVGVGNEFCACDLAQ